MLKDELRALLIQWRVHRDWWGQVIDRNNVPFMDVPVAMYAMLDEHIRELERILEV